MSQPMKKWDIKPRKRQEGDWSDRTTARVIVLNLCEECGIMSEDALDRRGEWPHLKGVFCEKCHGVLTS